MAKAKIKRPFAAVTGASSGIGYELAKEFAKNGYDLLIVAEDEAIHRVPSELKKLGAQVESVQIDLAKRKGVEAFYRKIREFGRPLDAIALNAGVGIGGDFARETDLETEINIINLNVTSTVVLAKLVLKDMVKRGEGRVLFTSSVAATMPGPLLAVYAASKAFIQSFAIAIRDELQGTGVTITSLMPTATETEFFERAHMENTKVGVGEKDDPAEVAKRGFQGLMKGEGSVAGSRSALKEIAMAKITPEQIKAKQYRKENERIGKKH